MADQQHSRETIIGGRTEPGSPITVMAWSIIPVLPALAGFIWFLVIGKIG